MATWETVCELVSTLPEAELDPPGSTHPPAWRVRGKVIVRLLHSVRDAPKELGEVVMLTIDPAEREALMRQHPEAFFVTPHFANRHVLIRLAEVDTDQLCEVLTDAWRLRAPKRLVREFDAG